MPAGLAIVLAVGAAIFAYHALVGLQNGAVRLPFAIVVFEEFERERGQIAYWTVVAVDIAVAIGLITTVLYFIFEARIA